MFNLRQSRLTLRLIFAFFALVLITTFFAGIPAYWLIQRELDRQAWSQLTRGQQVTQVLLANEEERLRDLAALTAQRPTLEALLQEPTSGSLPQYLRTLKQSVSLDLLLVRDPDGLLLTQSSDYAITPTPPLESGSGIYISGTARKLILIAIEPIIDEASDSVLGYVTVGLLIDDQFIDALATETGFEQRLLLNSQQTATSRADATLPVVERIFDQASRAQTRYGSEPYFTVSTPITVADPELVGILETALPVSDLIDAKRRALALIALNTALVSLLGSGFGIVLARRLTNPLVQITESAQKMSEGDLITPIAPMRETAEIATLANTLEQSRKNIHRVLQEITQAKAWSDTLISSIVEGVVTFDTQGKITFFSDGASRILGILAADAVGQALQSVFYLAESADESFLNYIPPRGVMRQVTLMTRDDRLITLAMTGARLAPPGSDDIQVALVLRDVTEEEAARNLRSHFLSNITHEFRTPLSAISASIELLIDEAETVDSPAIQELTRSLHLSVLHLRTLIDNLLESSGIEAGKFSVRRRPIALTSVISEAQQVVQPLLARRQQSFSLIEPPHLPTIHADPTRLGQVMVNLLSNASKYSPANSAIDVVVESSDNHLRVAVLDRGSGIPEADRKNLFRRFIRLHGSGDEQYGIGLGLSVAKAIIEGHGGEIGVDARPDGGTVFWFNLPIEVAAKVQQESDYESFDC